MRFQPVRPRAFLVSSLGAALAVTVAACSSGGKSSPSASAPPKTTAAPSSAAAAPSPTGSSAAAIAQIKANWEAFFSPKTSAAKKISLLQNGQKFASVINAQNSSSLASSASSTVSSVTVESPTQAKVVYSVLLGGTPALKNQPGVAVFSGGVWKVGDQSFCALLTLENSGKAPTVCASAAG
jgi:glucose/arabinose dehydrogenase